MPRLLSPKATAELLNIKDPRALYPYIPQLMIGKGKRRVTRLFSEAYIQALATYAGHAQRRQIERERLSAIAQRFGQTTLAEILAQKAENELTSAIAIRQKHSPVQLASIFCVTTLTVKNWCKSGIFDGAIQLRVTSRRGYGYETTTWEIPARSVHRAIVWGITRPSD